MKSKKLSQKHWQKVAERRLHKIVKVARGYPTLFRGVPPLKAAVTVRMAGRGPVARLNTHYRGKKSATDVLSFGAPEAFRALGILGELVICTPILQSQALEEGHSPRQELDVLLIHGLLHLLGFDHEKGEKEAKQMARWERKLLVALNPRSQIGLIARTRSGRTS